MSRTALLAAALLFAGCLSNGGPHKPADVSFHAEWSQLALPFGDDHDHANAAQHSGLTTPNFEVLGHDPLISEYYGQNAGGYICGDARATPDGRRIAAVESRSNVGFALADVTDPAAPYWLGELVMENTYVYDLAVVPDGQHVVLVTRQSTLDGVGNIPPFAPDDAHRRAAETDAPPRMTWDTPCAEPIEVPVRRPTGSTIGAASPEDAVPRPMSILLVDISDPALPTIIDQHPLLGFGHSVYSTVLDGRSWLLVTTLGPAASPAPATGEVGLTGFELYDIVDTPLGARLEFLSTYRPPSGANPLPSNPATGRNGHDGWLAKHPGTGQTLAYLVGGDLFTILDVQDPRMPTVVGTWSEGGPGREGFSGVLHSVVPLADLRDGRHYTIVGPEWGGHPLDHPSGIVWVLDTTDPANIREVAAWTLPHEVEWSGTYMFSNHYYGIVNDTLLVSMYHGGIWAVDLSPALYPQDTEPEAPAGSIPPAAPFVLLPSVGVFMPIDEAADPAVEVRWTPNSQEVLTFDDGTMVTFDSWSGLWTFKFDAATLAPAPEPWPISPVR